MEMEMEMENSTRRYKGRRLSPYHFNALVFQTYF